MSKQQPLAEMSFDQLEREALQSDLDALAKGEPMIKRIRSLLKLGIDWKGERDSAKQTKGAGKKARKASKD